LSCFHTDDKVLYFVQNERELLNQSPLQSIGCTEEGFMILQSLLSLFKEIALFIP